MQVSGTAHHDRKGNVEIWAMYWKQITLGPLQQSSCSLQQIPAAPGAGCCSDSEARAAHSAKSEPLGAELELCPIPAALALQSYLLSHQFALVNLQNQRLFNLWAACPKAWQAPRWQNSSYLGLCIPLPAQVIPVSG